MTFCHRHVDSSSCRRWIAADIQATHLLYPPHCSPFVQHDNNNTHLPASFPGQLSKPVPERQDHSVFYWSKRWLGGSSISWTICNLFALHSKKINTSAPHHSIFMGRLLFLPPNQQCQSTKGMACKYKTTTTNTTGLRPFVLNYSGEPVPGATSTGGSELHNAMPAHLPIGPMIWKHDIIHKTGST